MGSGPWKAQSIVILFVLTGSSFAFPGSHGCRGGHAGAGQDSGLPAPAPTRESSGPHSTHCQRWSEMVATFQLHLVCQLLPDSQQGTGSVGWAGQQLLKPGPFFLTERKEGRGQHGENKNLQDPHNSSRRLKLEQTVEAQSKHKVQYQGTEAASTPATGKVTPPGLLGAAAKAEADDQGAVAVALCKKCLPLK